jgi:hypothetical protein
MLSAGKKMKHGKEKADAEWLHFCFVFNFFFWFGGTGV